MRNARSQVEAWWAWLRTNRIGSPGTMPPKKACPPSSAALGWGSVITSVPPERSTRPISTTAAVGSGRWHSASAHVATSKVPLSNGIASSEAWWNVAAGSFERATSSISADWSTPTTSQPFAARWAACRPVPQAASSASTPGPTNGASSVCTCGSSAAINGFGPS